MGFQNINQFYWLLLFAVLAVFLWRARNLRKQQLSQLIETGLLNKIFPRTRWIQLSFRKFVLQWFCFLLIIVALAGPQIGQKLQETQVKGGYVFVLFDCSDSMLAEDFKPNRMEKSKRLLTGLIENLSGYRVGIIAFAGQPYVYCPMTFDLSTVKQFLKSIEPGMIPQPGTAVGSAVRLALSKMPEVKGSKAIILLTDGEDHRTDPIGAAEESAKMNVKIFTIGIGNPEGEPIPMRDQTGKVTGYKRNKKGEIILSRMDEQSLAKIALTTGGTYFRATESEQEIDLIKEKLDALEKDPISKKQVSLENRYQWFLAAALLLWLLSESLEMLSLRRIFFLFLLIFSFSSQKGYSDSFEGKMKEGSRFYQQKKYSEALKSFQKAGELKPADQRASFNKGTAFYKLGDWDSAQNEFKQSAASADPNFMAKAFYNLGTSQFQKGQYADAVQSYQQSLKLNPSDPDTKHNLQLALQLLKNPPQKQPQPKETESQKQKMQTQDQKQAEEIEKKEREENAKRILKSAADEQNNKPLFQPRQKGKKSENEEDW